MAQPEANGGRGVHTRVVTGRRAHRELREENCAGQARVWCLSRTGVGGVSGWAGGLALRRSLEKFRRAGRRNLSSRELLLPPPRPSQPRDNRRRAAPSSLFPSPTPPSTRPYTKHAQTRSHRSSRLTAYRPSPLPPRPATADALPSAAPACKSPADPLRPRHRSQRALLKAS